MRFVKLLLVVTLLVSLCSGAAQASVVFSMTSAGADASYSYWDMTYTLTNASAQTVSEFDVYFDATLYLLIDPPNLKTDWNTFANNGPYAGTGGVPYDSYAFYNAQAAGSGVAPGGSDTFTFQVAYQGLAGGEIPQAQTYQTYDNSSIPVLLETGTTAVVPEPTTYALLCISLGVVALARRRMTRSV